MKNWVLALLRLVLWKGSLVEASERQWVNPNNLHPNEFQWDSLTDQQMADVKQLQQELAEVVPSSLKQWVDDFRRDINPDKEIAIWKHITSVYITAVKGRQVSLAYKHDVFKLLNTCSMAPREEVLVHANLIILSEQDANKIIDLYYAEDSE